jgi:hypothetical protein
MMEKTKYHIACQDDSEDDTTNSDAKNDYIMTTLLPDYTMEEWSTKKYSVNGTNIDFTAFQTSVCATETESQALIASWNGIRSILGLIKYFRCHITEFNSIFIWQPHFLPSS